MNPECMAGATPAISASPPELCAVSVPGRWQRQAQISQGQSILFADSLLPDLVNGSFVLGIPNVIWFALIATAVLTVVAFRTKLGRYLYALGGGEIVASHAGVPVTFYKILAFVLAGGICGLAGVMLTGQVGAGTPTAGSSLLLNSIAASSWAAPPYRAASAARTGPSSACWSSPS
ncbi:hypothetical protein [Mesorhizobium sp. STM 4661]|uniref:ABC transporter permease n=1 Tax=Mesorhizobium sp. STM 4661 TaxID=1297570 RepID=UPI0002BF5A10|nr:hypothetical protein [Mesorhizobium sp. STM 4661]CCV12085.1 hypothetical protein MESS4_360187 [Mesorhizobium sp. STM 4661]